MDFSKFPEILEVMLKELKTVSVTPNTDIPPIIPVKTSYKLILTNRIDNTKYEVNCPEVLGKLHRIPNKKDQTLSSNHCLIEEKNGEFTLKDKGSTNGTYVLIPSGSKTQLTNDLELEISKANITILDTSNPKTIRLKIGNKEENLDFTDKSTRYAIKGKDSYIFKKEDVYYIQVALVIGSEEEK